MGLTGWDSQSDPVARTGALTKISTTSNNGVERHNAKKHVPQDALDATAFDDCHRQMGLPCILVYKDCSIFLLVFF